MRSRFFALCKSTDGRRCNIKIVYSEKCLLLFVYPISFAQKQRICPVKGSKFFAPLSYKKADRVRGGAPKKDVAGAARRKKGARQRPRYKKSAQTQVCADKLFKNQSKFFSFLSAYNNKRGGCNNCNSNERNGKNVAVA